MSEETERAKARWRQEFIKKAGAAVAAATASGMLVGEPSLPRGWRATDRDLAQFQLRLDSNLPETQRAFQSAVLQAFCDATRLVGHSGAGPIRLRPDQLGPFEDLPQGEPRNLGHALTCEFALLLPVDVMRFLVKQLVSLLRLVILETDSEGVDSPYIQTRDRAPLHDLNAVRRLEPRIEYIAKELTILLRHVHFYVGEERVAVTSFRLRDLRDWLVDARVDRYVRDPYASVLQYLSWDCRASCKFCLHRNDPDGYWTKANSWKTSREEIAARLKYYDPEAGVALFRTQDYSYHEVLTHPDVLEIIRAVRQKTRNVIGFATNGVELTEQFVESLVEFQPFYLMVGLNSANPKIRRSLMGDSRPEVAINSLHLLKEFEIPYAVSIVPWHENPLADLEDTIRYADKNDAYLIRVNLDGYSKHFDGGGAVTLIDNRVRAWQQVIECVRSLRCEVDTPIVFQPSLLEENLFGECTTQAVINGIVKNSPAAQSGLRRGDRIIQIDDLLVGFKTLAINLLRTYHRNRIEQFDVKVQREGSTRTFHIEECFAYPAVRSTYPHFSEYGGVHGMKPLYPYGILLQPTLNPRYLWKIASLVAKHQAKRVLFLSSFLIEPTFSRLVQETGFPWKKGVQFLIGVPRNSHFLGGSIVVGDLLVTGDFIECIREHGPDIDLVIIPSTPFGNWLRDISGQVYKEIERACGVPVELLETEVVTIL